MGYCWRQQLKGVAERGRLPLWAALLCALAALLTPSRAQAWTCDQVPATLPPASASELRLASRVVECSGEGYALPAVPMHLQAAICSLEGASEVAPMPVSPRYDDELSANLRCPELVISWVAPADDSPQYTPPSHPPDAALSVSLLPVVVGFAFEIHRRPTDPPIAPAHRRGVYRPPRA